MPVARDHTDWSVRTPRKRVSFRGVGRWSDETTATVLISDMSYQGCHIWSDHDLAQGETLQLEIPGRGTIQGQVRWVKGPRAGVRFLTGDSEAESRRARLGV